VEVATRDVAPPRDVRREAQAPAPTAAAANPPIGLEGFCPVSITEGTKWTKGDVRFGAIHRGRTYLFGSAAEQQKFLANPDKYSPMLSGFDVVKYIEQGTLVDGKRNHGIVHQGHMYLFTDEASLTKFCENPNTYIPPVQQAMQRAATRR
jgi:protein disulfide-isomerase